MMIARRLATPLLLLVTAIGGSQALAEGGAKSPPVVVEIAIARAAHVAPRAWIPGSIVGRDDARIAGIVAGRVLWIAEVGQRVAAGGVLAFFFETVAKPRASDL